MKKVYVLYDSVEESPVVWDITTRSAEEKAIFRAAHGKYMGGGEAVDVTDALSDMLFGVWSEDDGECIGGIIMDLVDVNSSKPMHLAGCELIFAGFMS